jgi:poly(3-hydroxybutyrate) depolymerase
LADQPFANLPLNKVQAEQAEAILVAEHRQRLRAERAAEHQAKVLTLGEWTMPYEVRVFGEKPATGHSLYISLHGGGGAPKRVNDQQWQNQKRLYELEEGLYVAPRAPTDTWNLWHQEHIDQLFGRLIENMIALEGIDPNRVYVTGYSAGGDGVYQLAPRMADRLAAAAMMAGHPNETQPLGLRNLPFTLHMGERDSAYQRNEIAQQWADQLAALQAADPQGYPHWVKIHAGKGHWMDRDDAEGVKWMGQFTRQLIPERVVWLQDDVRHDRFYWLSVGQSPAKEREKVVAQRAGNRIEIMSSDRPQLAVLLRDDMVDLDAEVTVVFGSQVLFQGKAPRTICHLSATLEDRGDPTAMFSAKVNLQLPQ